MHDLLHVDRRMYPFAFFFLEKYYCKLHVRTRSATYLLIYLLYSARYTWNEHRRIIVFFAAPVVAYSGFESCWKYAQTSTIVASDLRIAIFLEVWPMGVSQDLPHRLCIGSEKQIMYVSGSAGKKNASPRPPRTQSRPRQCNRRLCYMRLDTPLSWGGAATVCWPGRSIHGRMHEGMVFSVW